jgi:predicted CoA-binding protein
MNLRERIDDFLGQKRLAIVGVSREPNDFTRALFREFLTRGYDVAPVNPAITEMEGQHCFARLQEVAPPVDGAVLLTSPPLPTR